ncbi:MAG: FliH/SctL family protein [Burkholderiales bacterium]
MTSSKPRNIPSPTDGARASAYARFIPREELSSFAAWNPGDLGGSASAAPEAARAAAEPPKPSAAEQLAVQLRATRQSGYQDGYRDGLVALEAFKQSFASQTTAQVGLLMQSLTSEMNSLQQDMARTLAVCATHLARQIVRTELSVEPAHVALVAHEALDTLLLSARHITLRVHPDDHALVLQGAAEALAARGARLLQDTTITRGGCLVESDIGVIDASIETRWRRATAALGVDDPWEPATAQPDDMGDDA